MPSPLTKCRPTSRQVVGTLSVGAALYYLYDTYVVGKKVVSLAVLEASDDSTTNGIIAAFKNDATFVALAQAETSGILARDKEDGDKLMLTRTPRGLATRTSLPCWVRTGRTGRLAPKAPRTVRTGYAYQPRALGTYRVPWPPR